ncbi:hypothetical protein F7725_014676 [Dissostichus mawsoni]|uniref:Uncharacterized protein n=1 Tax=Dissostichus mawsoni TaxID=36200 RepID=A0A7J5Z0Y3_DISMA|nr:hypothetical protein F7725_014676 [Dissostichus mawsoni]
MGGEGSTGGVSRMQNPVTSTGADMQNIRSGGKERVGEMVVKRKVYSEGKKNEGRRSR